MSATAKTWGTNMRKRLYKATMPPLPQDKVIRQTATGKGRQHLTPRKLLYQLLDDYFNALTLKEMPSDIAVPRQTAIDDARLEIIKEYERFAGKDAATDVEKRVHTEDLSDHMRRALSEATCPKLVEHGVPVHKHTDGRWWFWDETWADELGPYSSRGEAETALDEYADQLLGPQWSDPLDARGEET
jgi:hypothetical protein